MNPTSQFFLSFFNRTKYTFIPIVIISALVYYFSKKYYEKLPRYYVSESKLFPVITGNESPIPAIPYFTQMQPSSSSSNTDFYNLTELLGSRTIREEIAKRRILLNGQEQYIYEQAIKDYNENPDLEPDLPLDPNNIVENIINGGKAIKQLASVSTNESNFVLLTTNSYNEDFAVALGNVAIDILSDFYVKFNQQPLDNNFYQISRTKDSLEYELDRYETAYAKYLDENKFIVKQEQNITEKRLLRRLTSIESALASVSNSYYASKSKVENNKPILKVLDRPMKPLKKAPNEKSRTYPIAWALLSFVLLIILTNSDIIGRWINRSIDVQKQKLISQES